MHSKIYQVSTSPVKKEDFIDANFIDFMANNVFFDYVIDLTEEEQEVYIAQLPTILDGICCVNGRELTIIDVAPFCSEWQKKLVKAAESINPSSMYCQSIKNILSHTHKDIWSLFYICDWSNEIVTVAEFVNYCSNLEPGSKLYLGGVVDYHI